MSDAAQPCVGGPTSKPSAVTEALRRHVDRYRSRCQPDPEHLHVLHRLLACRTARLGMHSCVCTACGFSELAYSSCRDRHCPQCQGRASAQWLAAREEKMLPVGHFQVVFTLPSELRAIAFDNQKFVYGLLFQIGASILQDLASKRLEARLGLTGVLHTWTSELTYHPHVHFLVTAGGLHHDDESWVSTGEKFLFPGRILGAMFRGRFLEALIAAFERGELTLRGELVAARKSFRSMVRALSKRHARWVVHVDAPAGRPVSHVAKSLARYIKRVAISGARIVSVSETTVSFQSRRGLVTLDGAEFVHRFLLHVLPKGFRKIRPLIRSLLSDSSSPSTKVSVADCALLSRSLRKTVIIEPSDLSMPRDVVPLSCHCGPGEPHRHQEREH